MSVTEKENYRDKNWDMNQIVFIMMFAYFLLWEQNVVKKRHVWLETEKFLKRFNFFLTLMKARKKTDLCYKNI